eukprot:TRINITY_DN4267_c0_g1_i1.p1 TRINITY_DN4267_c0_g1~~TRINITY_DN4267_c0_g1_i1.p1  ORF type:complete len:326 (+),score=20.93 TRINITY_DN4267_c0_g1_i1:671-1648(+)
MRILSKEQVESLLTPELALSSQKDAFLALAARQVLLPPRTVLSPPEGPTLIMPCSTKAALGLKVVSVRETQIPSLLGFTALVDVSTGGLLAVLNAAPLTSFRTAGGSALAARVYANPNSLSLLVFGSGAQAASHIKLMLHIRPGLEAVAITSRSGRNASLLCSQLKSLQAVYPRVSFTTLEWGSSDVVDASSRADIIITTTPSRVPLLTCAQNILKPGCMIIAIGAYTHEMIEVDAGIVEHVKTIIVDEREAALAEAGDLVEAFATGRTMIELGDLLAREEASLMYDPANITLFKSVGVAVQDLTIAAAILQEAERHSIGTVVPF